MMEESKFMPLFAAVSIMIIVAAFVSSPFILEAGATPSNAVVTGNVQVQQSCTISFNVLTVVFGGSAGVPSGSGTGGANNAILVSNGGDVAAAIYIAALGNTVFPNSVAGNWLPVNTLPSNTMFSFNVGYTYWNAISGGSSSGSNGLSNTLSNTAIIDPGPSTIGGTGTNIIYLGLTVPGGIPANTYQQTINIENSC